MALSVLLALDRLFLETVLGTVAKASSRFNAHFDGSPHTFEEAGRHRDGGSAGILRYSVW
jgi:hypothetical protein